MRLGQFTRAFFLGVAALGLSSCGSKSASNNEDWAILGGTSDVHHFSALDEINGDTVKQLGLAWAADIPSVDGLVGQPLVVDGIVYQSGPSGRVYANDVRTGELKWKYEAEANYDGISLASFWSMRYNRGLAAEGDNVIVATGDCRLIAINRKSGAKAWETVSCERTGQYGITAAPRVGGGMVFTGNNCIDSGEVRGFVDAFDAKTGTRKWRFYTVPGDPAKGRDSPLMEKAAKTWGTDWYSKTHGCGSVWDSITYDEKLGLIYFGTAGPAPWSPTARAADAGDELFTNSIIALDAKTGEYRWHFKAVPNDAWNFDMAMPIVIAELPLGENGSMRRVVMQAPKNGFFYVLDAATGKFISGKNFTDVNWASGLDPKTGRPILKEDGQFWKLPGGAGVVSPGPLGAHNWQSMAFSQETGLVYIPVIVAPTRMEIDLTAAVGGMRFDMYHASGGKDKWKAYGELVAWDPVKQEPRWRVRRNLPMNGGTLATAGNVVFQGAADGTFDAFDARTGKQLWSYNVGGSVQSAPTSVNVDGKQTILIASGNAGSAAVGTYLARYTSTPATRSPARLLAFNLGGKASLPAPTPPPAFIQPTAARPNPGEAQRGEKLMEAYFCVDCHGLRVESARGAIPDLRYAGSPHDKQVFASVVRDGALKSNGMPAFPKIPDGEREAIRAYILQETWRAYDQQERNKK